MLSFTKLSEFIQFRIGLGDAVGVFFVGGKVDLLVGDEGRDGRFFDAGFGQFFASFAGDDCAFFGEQFIVLAFHVVTQNAADEGGVTRGQGAADAAVGGNDETEFVHFGVIRPGGR